MRAILIVGSTFVVLVVVVFVAQLKANQLGESDLG